MMNDDDDDDDGDDAHGHRKAAGFDCALAPGDAIGASALHPDAVVAASAAAAARE